MKRIATLLVGCCLGLLFAASTCFAQMYTVTEINEKTWPHLLNASGQSTGWFLSDSNGGHDDCFRTGPNLPLNPATDDIGGQRGRNCRVTGINDSGQVVGYFPLVDETPVGSAFRTAANAPILLPADELGFLDASSVILLSVANGINNLGQAVGTAVVEVSGLTSQVGNCYPAPPGPYFSHILYAFRTAPNRPIRSDDNLGFLGGWNCSAWNYSALAVGSIAYGVNNFGEVVGISYRGPSPFGSQPRAFIYSKSAMLDLNDLIPSGSGWVLLNAWDIDDNGVVKGTGSYNGSSGGCTYYCFSDNGLRFLLTPIYKASVQQPINADGSSVFNARRGVIPVKFAVTQYGTQQSCVLPATIAVTRTAGGTLGSIDESTYSMSADSGSNFRIDGCQYVYNLAASSLGVGTYQVDISINGIMVGHAVFALK